MIDERLKLPPMLLTPRGPYRPGDAVVASWTVTNVAGHDIANARVAFDIPAGVDVVPASSTIAGMRGEALAGAFTRDGLGVGALRKGETVSAVLDLRVARESASPRALCATLYVDGGSAFSSEPVEVVMRGRALLGFDEAPRSFEFEPGGGRVGISFTLHNAGEARAERIDLAVPPVPGYVLSRVRLPSGSAAVAGKEPFRLPDLPAAESLDVVLEFESRGGDVPAHVRIEGMRLSYTGGNLFPGPIPFGLDRGDGRLDAILSTESTSVEPGSVIRLDLTIRNAGPSDAPGVVVGFELPPEMDFCFGTIAVGGGCDPRRNDPRAIPVGTVLGRSQTTVALYATIAAPLDHDGRLVVGASVGGAAIAPLELVVKSEPAFLTTGNCFELDGPAVLGADESRVVRLRAVNTGTADARGVRVRVCSSQLVIERAAIVLSSGARELITMKPTVSRDGVACAVADLGSVAARDIKTLEVVVRAPDHFSDGDSFDVRATVSFTGGEDLDIGAIAIVGRCRPQIDPSDSGLRMTRTDALRAGGVRGFTLRVKNSGMAPARGVTVSLNLPGMLAIEAINGEPARSDVLAIRDIPAGAAIDVPIVLRLLESVDGGTEITIAPVVGGEAISSVALAPVVVTTAGQALLDEVAVTLERRDREVLATLRFRNVGDAVAHQVVVTAIDLSNAYALESTRLADVPIPDIAGGSVLRRGLILPPIEPGRDVVISHRLSESDANGVRVAFAIRSRLQDDIVTEPVVYRSPSAKPVDLEAAPAAAVVVAPVEPAQTVEPVALVTPAEPVAPAESVAFVAPETPVVREDVPHFVEEFTPLGLEIHANGHRPGAAFEPLSNEIAPVARAVSEAVDATLLSQGVATLARASGLVGLSRLSFTGVDRLRRTLETALDVPALGTYRHFLAVRALAPSELLGASERVCERWELVRARIRADLRTPFAQAASPGFQAHIDWAATFYDASSCDAASHAIATVREAAEENLGYDDVAIEGDHLRGDIGRDFESYLSASSEPSGSVLNLILAEALPTDAPGDPLLAKSLKRYRERLKLLFAALLYANATARHERMLSGLDVELDDTLRTIVDRLRVRPA
jgi:uncharacterized repeat protein (TIGR01451 family)